MKYYDLPDSLYDFEKLSRWTKAHDSEISKALSDVFTRNYSLEINHIAKEVTAYPGGFMILSLFLLTSAYHTLMVGLLTGFLIYCIIYLFAKFVVKRSAILFFEKTQKEDIIKQCFAEILNIELNEATTEEERTAIKAFYKYAVDHWYEINIKYTK